jgi:hypothetical protein
MKHDTGPYEGFSCEGKRLFNELDRLLAQPNGLQQLFDEFGRRQVCDAILSEELPMSALTLAEIKANLDGFLADNPDMVNRKFDFTMQLLDDAESAHRL